MGFSYNEPTIFVEYVIDAAREAHRKGKYTVFVTNGYGTVEMVRVIKGYIDAVVVDYKGSGRGALPEASDDDGERRADKGDPPRAQGPEATPELTDLIIPQVGEDLEEAADLLKWLYDNLGRTSRSSSHASIRTTSSSTSR